MKKLIRAASAFSLVAALAMAAPNQTVPKTLQETPGVPYTSTGPFQASSATFVQILSTDFEAPAWQAGTSVCGDQFKFDECVGGFCVLSALPCVTNANCKDFPNNVTCTYPVTNSCLFKNHAANQNCCPDDEHNPANGDPNPYTGWSMAPSSRHCRVPKISTANPFGGIGQHLRFERDLKGGQPAGCTGSGSACRTRAITAQVYQPAISRAVWEMEINWSNTLGSSMVQFTGQNTSVGSINLVGYMYWYYMGGLYIYDANTGTFAFGGYWSNYLGQYENFTADYDPCNDTVTYSYAGSIVHVEPFGFTPPYGDQVDDTRAPSPDTTFYTQDHRNSITDIDNHFVTYTPCTAACCDGTTGVCTDGANALTCSGPSKHFYPNVLCSQLGTAAKYPPACSPDTAACCDGLTGLCTDQLQSNCSGPHQTWNKGTRCASVAGVCNTGAGNCSGGFCAYGFGKIGGPCAVSADCDVAGFCSAGKVGDLCLNDADCDIPTAPDCLKECDNDNDCHDLLYCNGDGACALVLGLCITGGLPCTAPTPLCDEATDTCSGCTGPADCPDDGICYNGAESCNLTSGLCIRSGNPCLPNQICDDVTGMCLNFGACCLNMGTVCFETNEPDCVDPPPNGAGGVFLGHKSACPKQNAVVVPEGGGTVFIHVVGPPVVCPPPSPARAVAACPPSGPYTDPWVSDASAGMCHNFGAPDTDPIPAGFFDPGSDPFTSTVCLRGVPLGNPQYGDADTLISRSADPFDRCDLPSGTSSTVNIEIVALSLESVNPITVTYNGGQTSEIWEVTVDLSPGGLPPGTPPRTLTATKSHCNGGTYTSVLYVQPRFTFTKVGNPSEVRVLDTGMTSTPPVELVQSDPHPWVSDIDPFLGAMVDLCSDFHANISENIPLLECDCNANSRRDLCDIEDGVSLDCNANGVPDSCDLSNATSQDVNGNGVPDECERGACCDFHLKGCIGDVFEADCPGPQREWKRNERCADNPCGAFHCGPGDHWIDSCPPGTDYLDNTSLAAAIDLDLDPLCLANTALTSFFGPTVVARSPGGPHSINQEIVSATLAGGGMTFTIGAGLGANPLAPSLGQTVEQPGNPALGDSYFDVFFELDLGGGMYVYNQVPVRVEVTLTKAPPKLACLELVDTCIPLFTSPTPGTGIQVANLTDVFHCIGKDVSPGACCDGNDGTCTNGVGLGNCLGEQQRWTPNTLCADLDPPCAEHTGACCDFHVPGKSCTDNTLSGDCTGPGRTWVKGASCADNPCGPLHCGPGDHWIDTCPGGTDYLDGTTVYVALDLDLDPLCLPETAVALTGDAEVLRGAGSPHSMPTEMVSMTATGGGLTLTVGPPLAPSLGAIVEKSNPAVGYSFFDIFFELDLSGVGAGPFVYNQSPCRMEGQLTKVPPKVAVYTRLPECLPLYTSATPGTGIHVANLAAVWHCVGKSCLTGACCDGNDGTCTNGVGLGNCLGEQRRWTPNTLCADLDPPCAEHTGACCETLKGTCEDGVPASLCQGAQRIWTKGVTCADIELSGDCEAILGACCDGDAFSSCAQTTSNACNCSKCVWYKLTSCGDIECTHAAIPTVSEWGLMVLTLLLLIGAKIYFARRQTTAAS